MESSTSCRRSLLAVVELRAEVFVVHLGRRGRELFAVEHGGEDVSVEVWTDDDAIYVADDGPGIPPEKRAAIFDAGYTTRKDGIGLGLTFVAHLADTYGWECRVTESERGGARFEFAGVDVVAGE